MAQDFEALYANTKDYYHKIGLLVAKAWADPEYKKQVEADPKGALRDIGIPIPDDVPVESIPIPPRPTDLNDEQLATTLSEMTPGTSSTAGTNSTLSCPCCSVGTVGTAGSSG
ncbi:MAG: thiocillin family RiPP [Cyanobacteria bacterium P01_G01_bin.54]